MPKDWWPILAIGAVVLLLLRPGQTASVPWPSWTGGPGGAPGTPGQTPNGDLEQPGLNAPDPWGPNTGGLLPPNPSAGYGFGAYSQ